jgi:cell division protein FtsL
MSLRFVIVSLLGIGVLISALAVVYAKHETRRLTMALQSLEAERDRMNVEWGRLQLEQSTLATHGRIENIANGKLEMTLPAQNSVVLVRP